MSVPKDFAASAKSCTYEATVGVPSLLIDLALTALSFLIIIIGSELFTNAIEWLGYRLNVAEAAVGSLLAAVGTALPETFVPLVAFLMGLHAGGSGQQDIGVGAIIGAPLMLSTLAMAVTGAAALFFARRRHNRPVTISVGSGIRLDLAFFLPAFALATICGWVRLGPLARLSLVLVFIVYYLFYCRKMLAIERSDDTTVEHRLYFERLLRSRNQVPRRRNIFTQLVFGLLVILVGAHEFVGQLLKIAAWAGLAPAVVSLIVSPLATELPEKYNSVIWIRQGKDRLALGNITGAMVFQSCVPICLGLVFTDWRLRVEESVAAVISLVASLMIYGLSSREELPAFRLVALGGTVYVIFLLWLLF